MLEGLLRGRRGGDLGGQRVGKGVVFGVSGVRFSPSRSLLGQLELLEGDCGPFKGRMRM